MVLCCVDSVLLSNYFELKLHDELVDLLCVHSFCSCKVILYRSWFVFLCQGGCMAFRRKKIPRRKSRRSFTKGALRVHKKNGGKSRVMRGGYRL